MSLAVWAGQGSRDERWLATTKRLQAKCQSSSSRLAWPVGNCFVLVQSHCPPAETSPPSAAVSFRRWIFCRSREARKACRSEATFFLILPFLFSSFGWHRYYQNNTRYNHESNTGTNATEISSRNRITNRNDIMCRYTETGTRRPKAARNRSRPVM